MPELLRPAGDQMFDTREWRGPAVVGGDGIEPPTSTELAEHDPSRRRLLVFDPIRKCAAPLADRPHARSWGYSAVARGRSEGVMFGSEHVDRGETRLPCDAVPKVNCKADVAGPKGIPSAAND